MESQSLLSNNAIYLHIEGFNKTSHGQCNKALNTKIGNLKYDNARTKG